MLYSVLAEQCMDPHVRTSPDTVQFQVIPALFYRACRNLSMLYAISTALDSSKGEYVVALASVFLHEWPAPEEPFI